MLKIFRLWHYYIGVYFPCTLRTNTKYLAISIEHFSDDQKRFGYDKYPVQALSTFYKNEIPFFVEEFRAIALKNSKMDVF